jgi:dihydroflavonol-4-reductase
MQVCLTGATGFIGANVVRALLERGDQVRCIIRKPGPCIDGLDIETVSIPLVPTGPEQADALAKAVDGCEAIVHVAGLFDPSPGGLARMEAVHVDATRALCAAGVQAGVRRIVLCSSSVTIGFGPQDAPGDEDTPVDAERVYGKSGALRVYHDTKLRSEQLVAAQTEMEGVIVNPDFILGPWDIKPTSGQLIVTMAQRWVPFYPVGGKCFQAAQDCAAGHLLALDKGIHGRRYLLGSQNLSYRDFMGIVAEVVGRRPPAAALPGWVLGAARLAGRVATRVDAHRFAGLDPHVLRSMQQSRYRSGARARTELGVPDTPIIEAVHAAYRWFVDRGYC